MMYLLKAFLGAVALLIILFVIIFFFGKDDDKPNRWSEDYDKELDMKGEA